jgi:phosphoglycerate dehydrogenase-like enzyme
MPCLAQGRTKLQSLTGLTTKAPKAQIMARIAILDDYQRVALKLADWSNLSSGHQIEVFSAPFASVDAAAAALAPFEIVCAMRERTEFSAALLAQLPNLKLLVTTGLRNAAIDLDAAKTRGIVVSGTPGPGHATAELSMGLILALSRNIVPEAHTMRDGGGWQTTVGRDLRGRTLGLLGLGKLGTEMAGFARAFGMPVLAWSQNLTAEAAAKSGAIRVEKNDLFQRADIISIHMKLSERTTGLVGAAELALMKPDALLINTSRGPIVDTTALIATLTAGGIAGAALDVYDHEPLPPNDPLRRTPRLLLMPHLGYVTEETYRIFYAGTVAAIDAWLAGKPVHLLTV